jgi:hypothetical protein
MFYETNLGHYLVILSPPLSLSLSLSTYLFFKALIHWYVNDLIHGNLNRIVDSRCRLALVAPIFLLNLGRQVKERERERERERKGEGEREGEGDGRIQMKYLPTSTLCAIHWRESKIKIKIS